MSINPKRWIGTLPKSEIIDNSHNGFDYVMFDNDNAILSFTYNGENFNFDLKFNFTVCALIVIPLSLSISIESRT